jgi:hypothetical protein
MKKMKKIGNNDSPQIILISAPHNGKIFKWVARETGFGQEEVEISFDELEELKKDHEVIFLTQAEGEIEGSVSHSEEEVIQRMKDAGEWTEK